MNEPAAPTPPNDPFPRMIIACVVVFMILFAGIWLMLVSDFLWRRATDIEVPKDFAPPEGEFDPQEWLRGGDGYGNTPGLEAE